MLVAPAKAGAQAKGHSSTAPFAGRQVTPWIPACAGMTLSCWDVAPAKAGAQTKSPFVDLPVRSTASHPWIPACAGMTSSCLSPLRKQGPRRRPFVHRAVRWTASPPWIPACAGTTMARSGLSPLRKQGPRRRAIRPTAPFARRRVLPGSPLVRGGQPTPVSLPRLRESPAHSAASEAANAVPLHPFCRWI